MARFGSWSQFGGASKFGGSEPAQQKAYRILRSPPISPPGFWPQDDDVEINHVLRTEAKGIGQGMVSLAALADEIFPQSCHDTIEDWESFLGVVPSPGATLVDRVNAVHARYRGGQGISLPELRQILYPLLHPTTAFYDDFADDAVSSRYETSGIGGGITETGGVLAASSTSPVDADWLADLAPMASIRLNDIDDGFTWSAYMSGRTINANTATGVCAFSNNDNAILFGLANDGGGIELRIDAIVEGVLTEDVGSVAIADPGVPYHLAISRDKNSGNISCKYGTDLADLTTLHTFAQPIRRIRKVGMFARNETATTNTVSVSFSSCKLVHETPENNVEIVEQSLANLTASGDAGEGIFVAFVHRESSDDGVYDIAQAQRLCDSVKLGHTLLLVGERDEFRCDDSESLCDRDILGA